MPRLDASCPRSAEEAATHSPARSGERAAARGGAAHLASLLLAGAAGHGCAPRTVRTPQSWRLAAGRRAREPVTAALRDRRRGTVLERLGAYDPEQAVGAGGRSLPRRRPGSNGSCASIGRRGRSRWQEADVVIEGDPELQRAIRLRALPPDGIGGGHRRGGCRRARADGPCLPRPRLLGQRRVRAPLPRGHPSRRPRGRCSSTACAAFPPPASWRARSAGRAPDSPGSRPRRPRRDARRSARLATGELVADPDRASSRSTSSATSPGRRRCYLAWTGDQAFADRAGPRPVRRDCALLGVARALRPRRAGAHLRRDRAGRVPRAGRRQRVHERARALEPAAGGGPRRRRRRASERRGWRSPRRSSTATTGQAASTSSSPASSSSSRW